MTIGKATYKRVAKGEPFSCRGCAFQHKDDCDAKSCVPTEVWKPANFSAWFATHIVDPNGGTREDHA